MPKLYKAQVRIRWRNRITGAANDLPPGTVVEFDEGDFDDPADPVRGAPAGGLAKVLERGLVVEFDPNKAGDPEHMSRDEMLYFLQAHDVTGDDGGPLAHDMPADALRGMMAAYLEQRAAAAAQPPTDAHAPARRPRRGGDAR